MIQQFSIRPGRAQDLNAVQTLFVDTVSTVCKADYDFDQISAWTAGIANKERWQQIITNQYLLVAEYQHQLIGFCSLENGCYIDLLYVHKDFQRKGVAYRLYSDIEKEARRQRQKVLTSHVSKTAKLFFERVGFAVIKEQTIIRQGIELANFEMKKKLTGTIRP